MPRRTPFAVSLQVGRAFGPLCELVRAGFMGDTFRAKACARVIAEAILFGARDRSRDKLLRTLYDQQARDNSLGEARPPRKRPKKAAAQPARAAA